jgi:methylmalonyl-CoA mutase N-terminal domain/subunit
MKDEAMRYIAKTDELGRIIWAIEIGYPQREIANAAYAHQKQLKREERIVVGLEYQMEEEEQVEYPKIDPEVERR